MLSRTAKFPLISFFFILTLTQGKSQIKEADLQIFGLVCSLCTNSVERAVSKLEFVESVTVDLQMTSTRIKFKDNQAIDIKRIAKTVENAGFSIGEFTFMIDAKLNPLVVDQCFYIENSGPFEFKGNQTVSTGLQKVRVIGKSFMSDQDYSPFKALNASCNKNALLLVCS